VAFFPVPCSLVPLWRATQRINLCLAYWTFQ
jgi:hypothetical protein